MESYGGWLIFLAIIGGYWAMQRLAARQKQRSPQGDQELPSASLAVTAPTTPNLSDELAAIKADVRADFDQAQADLDKEAKLAQHRKHIEKVAANLKKAGADHDLDDFIENTRQFAYWNKGGHLSYLGDYGVEIVGTKERGPDKDDRSYGYTFKIDGREWTVRLSETGPSWVDTSTQNGKFAIMRGEQVVFRTSMSKDTDREWSRWAVSLYFIETLDGMDWLRDVIRLNEVVKMHGEAQMRQRNREEAAERASALRPRG